MVTPDAFETMDVSDEKHRHSAKTLRNQHGSYPVWVSKRKIQQKKGKKKAKVKTIDEGKITKRQQRKQRKKRSKF